MVKLWETGPQTVGKQYRGYHTLYALCSSSFERGKGIKGWQNGGKRVAKRWESSIEGSARSIESIRGQEVADFPESVV